MSWSGRSLRARLKAIREDGLAWEARTEPETRRDSLRDLVREFTRDRRGEETPPIPIPEAVPTPTADPPNRVLGTDTRTPNTGNRTPNTDTQAGAAKRPMIEQRFAGFGRRRRGRRSGREAAEAEHSPWPTAAMPSRSAARLSSDSPRSDSTCSDDAPMRRDGSLWVLEERIDPRVAGPDHFSPEFAVRVYRERRTGTGAELPPIERLIYFDLETTGLASHDLLFMSGVLYWEGEELVLRQEVAEDVAEERELVARVRDRIHERGVVVTYNGRSFDLPALDRRLRFHGLDPLDRRSIEVHDLLHLARRLFRKKLPNCKLSTLEREVICKQREGRDVPGLEVPLRFLDFQESGDWSHLVPVLYHNRIDLTTMVALFPRLLSDRDGGP